MNITNDVYNHSDTVSTLNGQTDRQTDINAVSVTRVRHCHAIKVSFSPSINIVGSSNDIKITQIINTT